jgi:hypothetical protein
MKKVYYLIAMIGVFMICTAPLVSGQDLDRKWFKMTFSTKGYMAGDDLAVEGKVSGKVVNYFQFVYNNLWSTACPAGYTPQFYPFYEIHVWYPVGGGWEHALAGNIGPGEACYGILCPDGDYAKTFLDRQFVTIGHGDRLHFYGEGGLGNGAAVTTVLDIKRKGSAIKSATLNSYGCASEFNTGNGGSLGLCTLKGKLIEPEQLPDGLNPAGAGLYFTVVDACEAP